MFEDILGSVNSARNSVQNALGVTNNSAGLGSFRGVSFYTFREQRQTGGRRIVKREYPLRDEGGAIDLGRKLTERTFTACLLGKNAKAQCDALLEALDAAGAGELMHPEYGTLSVLVDNYECRAVADELNYYEFTITVYPEATATAPEIQDNTGQAVAAQTDSLFGELGDTLAGAWSVVQEGIQDATTVLDAINGVFDDIYNAVENIGIMDDVNRLMGAITAVQGNIEGLINTPSMLAANVLGALSGITSVTDASSSYRAFERLGVHLSRRADGIDTSHISPGAAKNVQALFHVASTGALASQTQAASGIVTLALERDSYQARSLSQSPTLFVTTAAGSSTASPTVTASLQQNVNQNAAQSSLLGDSPADTPAPASVPLFESAADIARVATALSQALDSAILTAADAGFTRSSTALRQLRLVAINDLQVRGLQLAGVSLVIPKRTEPALVTLYRQTGNSRQHQRLARRNGIANPLFVPGGVAIEVINEPG
ncbi:DNA circularization protein [Serratia nevei]|uniref:DNA circularization protein n=1 Tax=Serratia nevei TaxID=2703794 RepID=UPI0028582C01|nr:DNA circularization N-terminal domain-containing protein [Serratia nevei]MDR8532995.1 DNA circularization N-terminal domain-containing protein [Serratia nevei]